MATSIDPLFKCLEAAIASNLANQPTWDRDARRCLVGLADATQRFPEAIVRACAARLESGLDALGFSRRAMVLQALEDALRALETGRP